MNVIFDIEKYSKKELFFLDTKDNILMDGKFTKIIYSNNSLTTIGLYFKINFTNSVIQVYNKRCTLKFENNDNNCKVVSNLVNIEKDILDYYKHLNKCKKRNVMVLSNLLSNGNIKLYTKNINRFSDFKNVIKISGVWETDNEVGITYKFLEGESLN